MIRPLVCVLTTLVAAISTSIPAQQFSPGDVFLATPAATGLSSGSGGIVRIDLSSGTTSLFAGPFHLPSLADVMDFDPSRNRLVFSAAAPNPTVDPVQLWELDAAGAMQSLGFHGQTFAALAARGDGRIYLRQIGHAPGRVRYLDAANQLHHVMDASGALPFTFVPGSFLEYRHMTYHAPTNSLIVAAASGSPMCGAGLSTGVAVFRAPLSGDGTRVIGPVTCNEFEVSTSGEFPVGLSQMPDGDLLLVVDTNSGQPEPRMIRVDPFTLAMSSFASNGHLFAAATNAGCYSTVLGKAVILDTGNDVLRAFSPNEIGAGTVIAPGSQAVSQGGSSNELATMLAIDSSPCAGSFELYDDGLAGTGGFTPTMSGTGCPQLGGTVALHITSGLGGTIGALGVGFAPASWPVLGGTVLVTPAFTVSIALSGVPGSGGGGQLSIPLPLGATSIPEWYFQAVLLDAGAAQGVSMSNGLIMKL